MDFETQWREGNFKYSVQFRNQSVHLTEAGTGLIIWETPNFGANDLSGIDVFWVTCKKSPLL